MIDDCANQVGQSADAMDSVFRKRKEIYKYEALYALFAMGWSVHPEKSKKFRVAVASFIEEYANKISVIQLDDEACELIHRGTFDHPYPPTKVMWIPDHKGVYPDLLATTGDYLRLWRLDGENGAKLEVRLNNNKSSQYCAPLTSCDWNEIDLSIIAVSSIDTTCTIWQIETGQAIGTTAAVTNGIVKTQLIAHEKEVCDVEFTRIGSGREVFASAGADGSIRIFDMRHLEHSTIIYEEPSRTPLLRLACNKQDSNYIAFIAQGSNEVPLIDVRIPNKAIAKLRNHHATVNGIAWSPYTPYHVCTAGDDNQALIWDMHYIMRPVEDPILAYQADGEINQVHWSAAFPEWIAICYDKYLEILKV